MSNCADKGIKTRCVHAGRREGDVFGTMHDPIYMTSNYRLPSDGSPVDWAGIHTNIYARNGNVNQFSLQDKLAAIEGAEACVVMGSGVAALSGIFLTFLKSGDHVVCSQVCYSAVGIMFRTLLPNKFNIEASMIDSTDLEAVKAAIKPNTKLIHIETPGNPTTGISDIAAIAKLAKEAGALLSVDGTFASPLLQNPLALGADLSMHSMTKYINGHGDALGGCVLGKTALIDKIKEQAMVNFGGIISPFNAWLIGRGLITLPLRMRQHSQTAQQVAEFLEQSPAVRFVYYPGLKSHPQHEVAKRQMNGGYSGMISFDIKGGEAARMKFLNALKLISHAVSLGDAESLIVFPDSASPHKMQFYPEVFRQGYYRFSVGLEDAEDIIADLDQAFKACGLR
ncbi:MAG: PLP-dependent aspartate aminotransferase family protein [Deltaproteobacteria bacterium]|jgi:cystathionine gamma-synthase/methionine-gamma-lyase|nr:PLP-dependent aspartate aminotransferase family protein [Deltaproteobacteria bacterium]